MTTSIQTRRLPAQTSGIKGFLGTLIAMDAAWRQRQHLSRLDDAALADIGLNRAEAKAEARQGIWNAPRHWKR